MNIANVKIWQQKNKLQLKRLLPQSLLARSLLILCVPMFFVQAVTIFIFIDRHWQTTTKELAHHIVEKAVLVRQLILLDPHFNSSTFKLPESHAIGATLSFLETPKKTVALPTEKYPGLRLLKKALRQSGMSKTKIFLDEDRLQLQFEVKRPEKTLLVAMDMPTKRFLVRTTLIFVMWSAGASLLFLLIAVVFMRNQVRPITRLSQAMEKFGKSQENQQIKPSGAVEIRQGTIAFNQMQQRIKKSLQQRTHMLAGVSHDLKTPLTRMKLSLAMMSEKEVASSLEDEVTIMTQIVDDYLAFAKGDQQATIRELSLRSFIQQLMKPFKKGTTQLSFRVTQDLTIYVRENALRRALGNLIENAVKYGSQVQITARVTKTTYQIMVEDNGPGIKASERKQVLQPFVRLDPSRNPETGGVGLGLAISQDIIRAHGGHLALETSDLGGLKATVTLPQVVG